VRSAIRLSPFPQKRQTPGPPQSIRVDGLCNWLPPNPGVEISLSQGSFTLGWSPVRPSGDVSTVANQAGRTATSSDVGHEMAMMRACAVKEELSSV
jgi:hypothetical protein